MRGGLDDALDRMARRDELRRRTAGQAAGTPPAVTELVEAVAAVVARHPELAITMGVEGAGEPVLLHFVMDDGIVQVSANNPLTAKVTGASPAAARHADFEPVDDAVIEDAVIEDAVIEDAVIKDAVIKDYVPAATYPPQTRSTAHEHAAVREQPLLPQQPRRAEQAVHRQHQQQAGPLPMPRPLRHEPEATELAAKRLAAMLREDPSLLHPPPLG